MGSMAEGYSPIHVGRVCDSVEGRHSTSPQPNLHGAQRTCPKDAFLGCWVFPTLVGASVPSLSDPLQGRTAVLNGGLPRGNAICFI